MGFIDCDSHVLENDETWSYLSEKEAHHRPLTHTWVVPETGQTRQAWVVDDSFASRFPSTGARPSTFAAPAPGDEPDADDEPAPAQNSYLGGAMLEDPAHRVEDLDALGIDYQVVLSTFFISLELENPLVEASLMRSYNRWIADRTADHRDRLGWTVVPPLRSLDRTVEELELGKANGACGVHLRGVMHGYYLSDPYFDPLYAAAQDLDLPMVVHVGTPARRVPNQPIGNVLPAPEAFMHHLGTLMTGFFTTISSELHVRFPRLRWVFVESGSSWAPGLLQQHARLTSGVQTIRPAPRVEPLGPDELAERNIFVACQADEDLPFLTSVLGPDVLVTGTDYAHNDVGTDLHAHATILSHGGLEPERAHRIVDANARRLFGIDVDHRPSEAATSTTLHVEAVA